METSLYSKHGEIYKLKHYQVDNTKHIPGEQYTAP